MELPFGDKMFGSLITMILGMGITFIVLIILLFSIKAMAAIFHNKGTALNSAQVATAAPVAAQPAPVSADPASDDDALLIAVLTAAVAACHNEGFIIKNVYRAHTETGWNTAAKNDAFDSRRITIQKRS